MPHSDWIERSGSRCDGQMNLILQFVISHTSGPNPAWTHIPQAAIDRLQARYNIWRAAYEATIPPHAKPQTGVKNEARDEAEEYLRAFVKQMLMNKGIFDVQFTQAEDGKYFSAALDWETHSNLHGPKSEVKSIKIR